MVPSPVAVLRAVIHRAVLPVRRRVRPYLSQTEGPSDPLLHQLLGLVGGLVGFLVYAATAVAGIAVTALYTLCYPVLRVGERVVDAVRTRVARFRNR